MKSFSTIKEVTYLYNFNMKSFTLYEIEMQVLVVVLGWIVEHL